MSWRTPPEESAFTYWMGIILFGILPVVLFGLALFMGVL